MTDPYTPGEVHGDELRKLHSGEVYAEWSPPEAPAYQVSEIPTQDDNSVWIWHRGREDYVLRCSCGHWDAKAGGDTQATSLAMEHVLDHDMALED